MKFTGFYLLDIHVDDIGFCFNLLGLEVAILGVDEPEDYTYFRRYLFAIRDAICADVAFDFLFFSMEFDIPWFMKGGVIR